MIKIVVLLYNMNKRTLIKVGLELLPYIPTIINGVYYISIAGVIYTFPLQSMSTFVLFNYFL